MSFQENRVRTESTNELGTLQETEENEAAKTLQKKFREYMRRKSSTLSIKIPVPGSDADSGALSQASSS